MTTVSQSQARVVISGCAMAALGMAGIFKLTGIAQFEASLTSWGIESQALRQCIAVAIPVVEIGLSLAWLLNVRRASAAVAAATAIGLYTMAYAWLWSLGKPPECNCFGAYLRFQDALAAAPWVICRNIAWLGAIGLSWRKTRHGGSPSTQVPRTSESALSSLRGFTLVELLLVITIICMIAALLSPVLNRARNAAGQTKVLATLGSHGKVLLSYTSDHKDFLPAFTDPKATFTVLYVDDRPVTLRYFDSYWSWHLALAERTFGLPWRSESFYESQETASLGTSIWYSCSFGADPSFWNYDGRTGPTQWRATRLAETLFHSQKSLLFASQRWTSQAAESSKSAPLSFCDGSAENVPSSKLVQGYLNGTGTWTGSTLTYPFPGMVTVDGVRGRDR